MPLALLGFAAVVIALALLTTTGGQSTYVGSEKCGSCHEGQYDDWRETMHGIDFATEWMRSGAPVNKYTYRSEDPDNGTIGGCASCHVVGEDDTEHGGFRTDEPWNSTHNLPLGSIGCENCHGPGSGHVDARNDNPEYMMANEFTYSLSCAGWSTVSNTERPGIGGSPSCHDGERMGGIPEDEVPGYYDSVHAGGIGPASPKGNPECYHCMAAEGFISVTIDGEDPPEEIEEVDGEYFVDGKRVTYGIYCGVCHDPHPEEGTEIDFQLRAPEDEICELCHHATAIFPDTHVRHPTSEFRNGMNGQDVPETKFMDEVSCPECHMYSFGGHGVTPINVGHSFEVVPQACVECHSMYTNETAMSWIEETQEHIEALLLPVEALHADAVAARDWATGNNTWIEDVDMTFLKGEWNMEMVVQEGSGGAHNPPYAMALMAKATKQFEDVIDAYDIGIVEGKLAWDDASAIVGADIKDGAGATVATTDSNGSYSFTAPTGAMTYTVWSEGKLVGTMDATATMHATVDDGTTTLTKEKEVKPPDDGEDGVGDWGLNNLAYILIIIIIVLIIVAAMMSRK